MSIIKTPSVFTLISNSVSHIITEAVAEQHIKQSMLAETSGLRMATYRNSLLARQAADAEAFVASEESTTVHKAVVAAALEQFKSTYPA